MRRGELWWARLEEQVPIVVLSGNGETGLRAVQIVEPATVAEKRGFVVLSGEEAADVRVRNQIIAAADAAIGAVGVEVHVGAAEGLAYPGVVRVALPRDGHVFCTWLLTLTAQSLIRRIGVLTPEKLRQLDNALRLAAIE